MRATRSRCRHRRGLELLGIEIDDPGWCLPQAEGQRIDTDTDTDTDFDPDTDTDFDPDTDTDTDFDPDSDFDGRPN
ncbi:MAG: hypothetical protein WBM40_07050 [Thiohalocapsa sp.]